MVASLRRGGGVGGVRQLFSFDVHEDIRMINDASKEKDESHAGKVVERHWYDKNKHIFPASRWEVRAPSCVLAFTLVQIAPLRAN